MNADKEHVDLEMPEDHEEKVDEQELSSLQVNKKKKKKTSMKKGKPAPGRVSKAEINEVMSKLEI